MDSKATILIVDDSAVNISLLSALLVGEYHIKVATTGQQAIEIARTMPVDLILLDVIMPDMDGFETCRRLKADPMVRRIPVVFVTACNEVADEAEGFACGAVDYIARPLKMPVVRQRVKTQIALYDQKRALEKMVQERTAELAETQLEILYRLGMAAEYRDNETGYHITRVRHYSRLIGLEYGLPEDEAELLYSVAPIHDVGKIGMPDKILFKPTSLDSDEQKEMRKHPEIGHRIIGDSQKSLLLSTAAELALSHHEKWDGSGYPNGLKGEQIPVFCRIVAIADVFDALTSKRPYKKAWSVEKAIEEICRCSGGHFDPAVVDSLLRVLPKIVEIYEKFTDTDDAVGVVDCIKRH